MLVRRLDWVGLKEHFVTGEKLTISKYATFEMEDLNMFPCIIEPTLKLDVRNL